MAHIVETRVWGGDEQNSRKWGCVAPAERQKGESGALVTRNSSLRLCSGKMRIPWTANPDTMVRSQGKAGRVAASTSKLPKEAVAPYVVPGCFFGVTSAYFTRQHNRMTARTLVGHFGRARGFLCFVEDFRAR